MRRVTMISTVMALACSPAIASEKLNYGPAPDWVVPQKVPTEVKAAAADAPVAVLLSDEQIRLEPGKVTAFSEGVLKIQNAEGLAAGNILFGWQPATDTVTVNKVHIIRDGKVIDVLKSGQTFTITRRESNMEASTLDGTLTANIQPEGLQVGDAIQLTVTVERADPIMKGHVETVFGQWNASPLESGHVSVSWPSQMNIKVKQTADLPEARAASSNGFTTVEFSGTKLEPLILPKGAPLRFQVGRFAEASDFRSWSQVADLMAPLYAKAATIAPSGPLREQLEAIRRETKVPKQRAEKALALVQQRVRYVALLMGSGGYVPAPAETSWERRFGDCKGKTALLLGLLTELGIQAEPVLVSTRLGDILPDRLPMVGYFDHVIVRAHVGGKTYWLDGTRSGDTDLDKIETPPLKWGLPVIADAELVAIVPPPLQRPLVQTSISLDATGGIFAAVPFKIERIFRGDGALALKNLYAQLTDGQADQAAREYWRAQYDYVDIERVTSAFDEKLGELRMSMAGDAKLDWSDGWFYVPESEIAFKADFKRTDDVLRDAPFGLDFPTWATARVEVRLPKDFASRQKKLPAAVKETLAGVEYQRDVRLEGSTLVMQTSERAIDSEVPYELAIADESRLRALFNDDVYLRVPPGYSTTSSDLAELASRKPASASEYMQRSYALVQAGKLEEAIDDLTEAEKLDPKNNAARLARAGVLQELGRLEHAIAVYDAALANDSSDMAALISRASAHRANGDDQKALTDTEAALKLGNAPPPARLLRANIFRKQAKHDLAVREAQLLIEENPDSDYGLVAAAKILSAEGRRADAMKALDRALSVNRAAFVYINRSQVRDPDDVAGRLSDLDEALKLDPDNLDGLLLKGSLLIAQERFSEAEELYNAALRRDDQHAGDVRVGRAIALAKLGQQAEAEVEYGKATVEAKQAVEFNNLCWSAATANVLLERALEACRRALEIRPNSPAYLDSLGMALLRLGRLDEALDAYNKALEHSAFAAGLMGRAFVHAAKGDMAKAEQDRKEALRQSSTVESEFEEYGLTLAAGAAK